jgi:NADPH-dependent 2,4-dienoyl-CoA reductase/sulfur reductase-like enzyme
MFQPSGLLVPSATAIKKATGATVMVVGKINAVLGEQILQEGSADFIQMGRALMADPELPNKAREGRLDEIRPCIYCGHCLSGGTSGSYANCTVNIGLGKELDYKIEPATQKKTVMVIGGGPAGMEAARTLAERGHKTSLYEKSNELGGQWKAVAGFSPEEDSLIKYLSMGLNRAGVKVFLGQEVNASMAKELKPDAIVIATGSTPTKLDIPGVDGKNVVQAVDVLTGKAETGQEIVVIGGRIVGITTALFLAEKGKRVSIVTRSDVARGLSRDIKLAVFASLIKYGVYLYPYSTPDSITKNGVNILLNIGDTQGRDNIFSFLKADTVVLAVGAKNENRLVEQLTGQIPEVYSIGDCAGKRSVFAAMRGGSDIAQKI